jgi:hypothetical protein
MVVVAAVMPTMMSNNNYLCHQGLQHRHAGGGKKY